MKSLKIQSVFLLSVAAGIVSADFVVDKLQNTAADVGFDLESPKVTDFGYWGEVQECTDGQVVTGFQLKVEPKHSIDDTALNGVRLFCGRPSSEQQNITSRVGPFGNWGKVHNCSTYAVGFELQSQEYQGPRTDDTAATNLKVFCADGTSIEGFHDNGHSFKNSRYTGPQMCSFGKGICGIQTQVERYQVFGDDTALNNLRVKCCPVVSTGNVPSVPAAAAPQPPQEPIVPIIGVESSTGAPAS